MSAKEHSPNGTEECDGEPAIHHHGSRKSRRSHESNRSKLVASNMNHDSHDESWQSDNQHDGKGMVRKKDLKPRRSDSTPELVRRSDYSQGQQTEYDPDPMTYADDDVDESNDVRRDIQMPSKQEDKKDASMPQRLLILSSKIKNFMLLQTAILPNVIFVPYKYETTLLENILSSVSQHLGNKKVETIALLVHCSTNCIYLSGKDDKSISAENIAENLPVREFFHALVTNHIDRSKSGCRLDFLACSMVPSPDANLVKTELEKWLNIPVGLSRDLTGSDIQLETVTGDSPQPLYLGELYFKMERLRWSGTNHQSLSGFEKIKTVGKGAYGTAVLYRKKDDDSLVILKEINLHDLTASERQMALNEVHVLAMLDHPNIISYYDSFEEDGVVMIEMEYADGGTLAQYLAKQEKPLSEKEILTLFAQIVSAIKYIHEHNILHRDLKTPNIFLTKEGRVKVGDFGISKLMATGKQGANTVLGTPYYISPEMCEGKPYNDKSDIWTLGCILYEMACLQRTFEGSNLPALVNKIMKGQFAPVKGDYSQEFKNLIMSMLQREPEFRPSAAELWHEKLPELMAHEDLTTDYEEDTLNSSGNSIRAQRKKTRSVLYYFEMVQMQLKPIPLRSRVRIRNVAVSMNHMIVVTMEHMVYTWGQGDKGQLGHGDLEPRTNPEIVTALQGKSVVRACCGEGFSVFASDNGIVMTCGDGTLGCLGHGDWCSTARPRLIEALLSVDIISVACGPQHVVAVGSESEVFTWGCGADGRLGNGSEENVCQPVEVTFQEPVCVRQCFCGKDGTMLLTEVGSVLACGSNQYNKLGLNHRVGFLMAMKNIFNKTEVSGEKTFCVVKALARHHVTSLCMGPNHSAVIVEPGHVYTFGYNADGQLGTGNLKQQGGPIPIKLAEEKTIFSVSCGEHYTVAGTSENDLLFWGTRCKKLTLTDDVPSSRPDAHAESLSASSSRSHSRQASTASISSINSAKDVQQESSGSKVNPETGENRSCSVASDSSTTKLEHQTSVESTNSVPLDTKSPSAGVGSRPLATPRTRTVSASKDDNEIVLQPTPLLRMDFSGSHSQAGDTVTLSQFFCHGENLFILVETTAPPPKRLNRKKRSLFRKKLSNQSVAMHTEGIPLDGASGMSASSQDGGDEYSSEASELDAGGRIQETDDTTGEQSDDEASPILESSMTSIRINRNLQHEQKAKLQRRDNHCQQPSATTKLMAVPRKHTAQKSLSNESGIDVTTDLLSSSSSSENMAFVNTADVRVKTNTVCKKTVPCSTPRKAASVPSTLPAITKSKSGPSQTQKPLSRLRAQGKTRRSDPKEMGVSRESEQKHNQESLERLQQELEQLRLEKQQTESRLQKIETKYHKEKEAIWLEAERKALEREKQLQVEILRLREDMKQQSAQLQDNFHVVKTLQEQLEKVQREQACLSARPESRQSQRESRICSLQ